MVVRTRPAPRLRAATAGRRPAPERPATCSETELRGLLAMAGHDLGSPLAVLAAHLEHLREDDGSLLGTRARRDLDVMERAVRRMARLAATLLTHARADQSDLRVRVVPLAGLVAEVTAERLSMDDGSRVTVHGCLPEVHADPDLLHHVLDNLIGNALKYRRPGEPARVEISARLTPAGGVRVEVADHGIGIPEGDRTKVFDAFHRSANSAGQQGSGLGLAICRRIVERHGGHIGVDPHPGGGSRFWFTLPESAPGGRG
jgi:signal transduction histidine kinase